MVLFNQVNCPNVHFYDLRSLRILIVETRLIFLKKRLRRPPSHLRGGQSPTARCAGASMRKKTLDIEQKIIPPKTSQVILITDI